MFHRQCGPWWFNKSPSRQTGQSALLVTFNLVTWSTACAREAETEGSSICRLSQLFSVRDVFVRRKARQVSLLHIVPLYPRNGHCGQRQSKILELCHHRSVTTIHPDDVFLPE